MTKSLCFLRFFNTFIKNVVISLNVCKKCSVTWLELLKKQWNSLRISTKVLRHTDGIIENPFILLNFLTFLKSWIHKNLRNHWNSIGNTRNAAPSHRWSYSKNRCFIVVFFHCWNHEFMLICKNVVFQMKFQQLCSFMSMELFKKAINSCRCLNTFELMLTSDFRKS